MNYSTAVFLINKNVRAVQVTYEATENASRETFKTLDKSIKVDDFVVVPTDTRHKMTVCKVVAVDVDVNFDSSAPMAWIIGVVDRGPWQVVMSQEGDAIAAIRAAEVNKKRDDLRKALLADHADQLKALPISVLNGDIAAGLPGK